MDGLSNIRGRSTGATADHARMAVAADVIAARGVRKRWSAGMSNPIARAGRSSVRLPLLAATAGTAATANRTANPVATMTRRLRVRANVEGGRSRIAAMTLNRLMRTLAAAIVISAITRPRHVAFTMLVGVTA